MKAIKPAIRRAEAKKFKIFLHKNGSTSFLLINKQKGTSLNLFGSFKENWAELEQLNNKGWDVYMTVNGQSGPRRLAENICKVNALFIDYDKGDWNAEDFDCFVSKFPVKPHFVTQSSPGCFHVYWLTEDVPLESFGKTQKQLAEKFGADAKVCDLPRVMRMPGTINWKRESEFVAKIVYLDEQAQPASNSSSQKAVLQTRPNGLE